MGDNYFLLGFMVHQHHLGHKAPKQENYFRLTMGVKNLNQHKGA
jgi:hypothetical protein